MGGAKRSGALRHLAGFLGLAWAALVSIPGLAFGADTISSEKQACETLKRAAVEFHLSTRDFTGRYYCDPLPATANYYVLALRVSFDEPVGSNLVGYFAITKADGRVLDWDINEDKAAPLAPRPPFEKQ